MKLTDMVHHFGEVVGHDHDQGVLQRFLLECRRRPTFHDVAAPTLIFGIGTDSLLQVQVLAHKRVELLETLHRPPSD
ncbi:hypothetical protein ACV35P_34355, partial [Pseudomonas aeruginosa]